MARTRAIPTLHRITLRALQCNIPYEAPLECALMDEQKAATAIVVTVVTVLTASAEPASVAADDCRGLVCPRIQK
jgi:hypothetical protein